MNRRNVSYAPAYTVFRFLSTGNIVVVVRITWGKIWGNNIYRGDEFDYDCFRGT